MATISVRTHAYVAAGLLAITPPLAMLTALRIGPFHPETHLLAALGGLTLLAQAVAFAYLPSFTKRELVLDGLASYAGPVLFPLAVVGAVLRIGAVRLVAPTLALALFGAILLASAAFGKRWRTGTPFWRAPGEFRAGDIAALVAFASAAAWLLATGLLSMARPTLLTFLWPCALALFALAALAHYVPRNRGRPIIWWLFLAGVLALQAGVALRTFARVDEATWLLLGLPLAALAIAPPAATKRAGARMLEAAPLLALAVPFSGLGVALLLVGSGAGLAFSAYYSLVAAIALGLGGLALLTLPVVFNQRPDRRWLWPTVVGALVGVPLLAVGFLTRLPRWPGALVLCLALLSWLTMMAPLRTPRRECPPDS
jgi:hypothetical protein